ncbi:MAG: hypothetical protein U1F27_09115 [Turneriella sp.]
MDLLHLRRRLLSAILPVGLFVVFCKTSIVPVAYSNEEIRIDFGGPFAVRERPGTTQYGQHLPQPVTTVDFCVWQPQPPEVQQVMRPERGYLCELHILPPATEAETLGAIEKAFAKDKRKHGSNKGLEAVTLGKHRVIRWRWQAGKSRLDHFLLIGKDFNYLFVSSPYGSNGTLEAILTRVKFRESARN